MANANAPGSQQSEPHAAPTTPRAADLASVFAMVHTERLILRRPDARDALALFEVESDPETNRFNPVVLAPDLTASEEWLHGWLQQWQEDGYGYWALTLPPAAEVVGFGGVRRVIWREGAVLNLYYRLRPTVWGHGYATEMARTAVALARASLPHLPILARIRPANLPSQRTAERAGLVHRPDLDSAEHRIYALGWQAPSVR
jgi:RimJ/RimL family protein N-acetyltransferase